MSRCAMSRAYLRQVVESESRNSRDIKGRRVAVVQGLLRSSRQPTSEYGGRAKCTSDIRCRVLKVLFEIRSSYSVER
jgi:hypothetical protein